MMTTYRITPPSRPNADDASIEVFDSDGRSIGWRYANRSWFVREVMTIANIDTRAAYLIARDEMIDSGLILESTHAT